LQRYKLEDMKLSGELAGDPLQGKTMTFAAQGQLLLDRAANVAEWTGIKISANQLRALGELKVNDLDKTPQVSGGLSIAQFDLAKFVDSIGQKLPAMAEGSLSKVELAPRLAGTPSSLTLDDINLKVDDSTLQRPHRRRRLRQAIAARNPQGRHLQRRPLPAAKIRRGQQRQASAPG
jgi:AsmA protein